tara:strand:- start:1052 stop:1765 length:714 start_codon:yes stop_codon:yes gene_type:complete
MSKKNCSNRNFKGVWIPKAIYLEDRLSWTEKILLVEINSLDNGIDGCFASNAYFGNFLGISPTSVSTCIGKLVKLGFVQNEGFNGRHRILRCLSNFSKAAYEKTEDAIVKNQKHNNTSNNTGSNSLYTDMISSYDEFCKQEIGVAAKIDGQQGKAMKSIIVYLKKQVKDTGHGDEGVLNAWRFILNKWNMLDDFTQKQVKISQINSNMLTILNQIRNGKKSTASSLEQKIRDRVRNR